MKQTNEFEETEEVDEVDDVPVSPLLVVKRCNPYGSVEGLDDEELADPDELERQVMAELWGPVLMIPLKKRHSDIRPAVDENGRLDWGAFGTVDFERSHPFDKLRYKAERLKEQVKNVLMMASMVEERLPAEAAAEMLKCVRRGIIDVDDIVSEDMRALARLHLRALRLQKEIRELQERIWRERRRRAETWLRSL